jgi:fructokinase
MTSPSLIGGIELGGTKSIAVLAKGHTILSRISLPTGDRPQEVVPALVGWLGDQSEGQPLDAIGIASFGPVAVDPSAADFGSIRTTVKPGWSGAPVRQLFVEAFDCPVAIDTDVNAAALAEQRWGAARGLGTIAYVTIGTGIGVGIVVDGHTVHGHLHPEAGHLQLRRFPGDDFAGACIFHGDCAEGLFSGPALASRFGEPAADVPPDDPRWSAAQHDFAQLLYALVVTISPQAILVGGGVGLGCPGLLEGALRRLPALIGGYLPDLDEARLRMIVRQAGLGADAGPLGAIAVGLRALVR